MNYTRLFNSTSSLSKKYIFYILAQFRRFADSNAEALFWCVLFIIMITLRGNMRLAKALKTSKRRVLEPLETAYCG